MDELETRLQNFFSEPSENEAKDLAKFILNKNGKIFRVARDKIIDDANYEKLYEIIRGCGKIAGYAGKRTNVLHPAQEKMKILGEPRNSTERLHRTLIETQFLWMQKENKSYNPSPPQAYAKA